MTATVTEGKISQFESMLGSASRAAVVTHTRPDGDAVGSAAAMTAWLLAHGLDARLLLPNACPANILFVMDGVCDGKVLQRDIEPKAVEEWIAGCDLVVCLDISGFDRAEGMQEDLQASKARKVLIDHHLGPKEEDFDLVFSETEISSTCELLFWILLGTKDAGGEASKLPMPILRALLAGMTTDTNNFANSVFPSTFEMASLMLAAGVDRDSVINEIYNRGRENRLRMMGHLLKDNMRILPCGAAYIVARASELAGYGIREGEMEGLVNMPLTMDKVRLSIFLKEDIGLFRVSVRSKRGTSAYRLAKRYFHGGGHEQASGGKLFFPEDIADASLAGSYIEEVVNEYFESED